MVERVAGLVERNVRVTKYRDRATRLGNANEKMNAGWSSAAERAKRARARVRKKENEEVE